MTLAHFSEYFRLLPDRAESEYSWTVDIAARRAQARERTQPLREQAKPLEEKAEADKKTPEQLIDLVFAKGREVDDALASLRATLIK